MQFLKKTKDFHEIFSNKKKINGNLFSVYYKPLHNQSGLKVGIIAGKKVGNAVKRNKFKRRIRAYFRENKKFWNLSVGIVVVAHNKLENSLWSDIKTQLDNSMEKIAKYENL